jgi:hypothetical protein
MSTPTVRRLTRRPPAATSPGARSVSRPPADDDRSYQDHHQQRPRPQGAQAGQGRRRGCLVARSKPRTRQAELSRPVGRSRRIGVNGTLLALGPPHGLEAPGEQREPRDLARRSARCLLCETRTKPTLVAASPEIIAHCHRPPRALGARHHVAATLSAAAHDDGVSQPRHHVVAAWYSRA